MAKKKTPPRKKSPSPRRLHLVPPVNPDWVRIVANVLALIREVAAWWN